MTATMRPHSTASTRALRIEGSAFFIAYLACIPLANWMILHVGTMCVPGGPCLIPVWPGIMSPSGVLVIGAAFTLRDLVQRRLGTLPAFAAVVLGTSLSAFVASPELATASAVAFLISETVDLLVYSLLARRSFLMAVGMSNVIGLLLDSYLFLLIAFGSVEYMAGQAMGKLWMTLIALPLVWSLRQLDDRRGIPAP